MGIIRVLPEAIANKIAAGEVVERPASIVKELVENALDADATVIEVEVAHGGKNFIRVSDNGRGMDREDAGLAFARHATSKIMEAEDLLRIRSFGFRGEALPSIAAVSRMQLVTSRQDDPVGTELHFEAGRKTRLSDCALRCGTMVEVRELFFNTPARRKFLKSDATEMGHIVDVFSNLALSAPDVRFVLRSLNKTVLEFLPVSKSLERAKQLLGEAIAEDLLEIGGEVEDVQLSGVIGKPSVARASRTAQSFFVNRRWVRSLPISYALQEGFSGTLGHSQFPIAVLFIEINPERVDINIHPTKQQVRLSHEPTVKALITQTVARCLRQAPDLASRPLKHPTHILTRATRHSPSRQMLPAQRTFVIPEPARTYQPAPGLSVSQEPVQFRDKLKITQILGQVHQVFLVVETQDGLLLVDQHAAHERVMFEGLLRNWQAQSVERQGLLLSPTLELSHRQADLLQESLKFLHQVGFDLEVFGPSTVRILAHPAILGTQDPARVLKTFLDQKEEGLSRTALDTTLQELAALIACKTESVKAHEPLTPQAIHTLLTRLSECDQPFSCPHGRPTLIRYSLTELERHFKRT